MEQVDSKVHLAQKPLLNQKRGTSTTKLPAEGSKRAKREGPNGAVVRRSERLLAAERRVLAASPEHKQQLKRRERSRRKNSSKQ